MQSILENSSSRCESKWSNSRQKAPQMPVLAEAQTLIETAGLSKGLGAHDGGTAVSKQKPDQQALQDPAARLNTTVEASNARGFSLFVNPVEIAINDHRLWGRSSERGQFSNGAVAKPIVAIEKQKPVTSRDTSSGVTGGGYAGAIVRDDLQTIVLDAVQYISG